MTLPKEIYITHEQPDDDGGWYSVKLTPEDSVSGSE